MPVQGPEAMTRRYGPNDTWPRHQKSYWNEALDEARAAEWTLNYVDAPHRFGVVSCPGGSDGNRHSFKVDKTAVGGETKSKEARKLIRTCQHSPATTGSRVRARQEECARLLGEAERLISMADEGLTVAEARAAAWADLERIETQLETAAASLVEILRHEEEEAWRAVDDTEDAPTLDSISATLGDAMTAVADSESVAAALKVRKPRLAKPFIDRAHQARTQIAELRERLAVLW